MDGEEAHNPPLIVMVMGVAGCGKSSLGTALAAARALPLIEGDDHHSAESRAKRSRGIALDDADRAGWLDRLGAELARHAAQEGGAVLTCSALKRAYRDIIVGDRPEVALVYLRGSRELIQHRMAARHEHFMPVGLLDSQFATLQEPDGVENPVVIDVEGGPSEIVARIVERFRST